MALNIFKRKTDDQRDPKFDHRISVTMVYSVTEEMYKPFIELVRNNMAPWLRDDIEMRKIEFNEGVVGLRDPETNQTTEIPMIQIVECGKLE